MRNKRYFKILSHICRTLLAAAFIFSGFVKAVDPWGTALKVSEYLSIYGLEFFQPCMMAFSIWLSSAELMMGCMLLFKVRIRMVSIFASCSMLFFTVLSLLSATVLPVEDCGCFGDALKLTPWQTVAKNLVLLPLALVVWWRYRPDKVFAFKPLEIVLMLSFFISTVSLSYYCYRHLPLIDFLPYKVGVNIHEAMNATESTPADEESEVILVYRNKNTGQIREFKIEESEWQDSTVWEWVDTHATNDMPVRPLISEFSVHDIEGDATEEITTAEGRIYMLCVTSFERLTKGCRRRFAKVTAQAAKEGARVICITPQPLYDVTWHDFGAGEVRCYNIDATTMKTLLRANAGMVVLDNGTIPDKKTRRAIRIK